MMFQGKVMPETIVVVGKDAKPQDITWASFTGAWSCMWSECGPQELLYAAARVGTGQGSPVGKLQSWCGPVAWGTTVSLWWWLKHLDHVSTWATEMCVADGLERREAKITL